MTNSHDHNEVHGDACAVLRPGDRECNCHLAYGFATADDMDESDSQQRASLIRFYQEQPA